MLKDVSAACCKVAKEDGCRQLHYRYERCACILQPGLSVCIFRLLNFHTFNSAAGGGEAAAAAPLVIFFSKRKTFFFFQVFLLKAESFLLSRHFSTVVILIYWPIGMSISKIINASKEGIFSVKNIDTFFSVLDFGRNKCFSVQSSSSSKQKSLHTNYSPAG